MSQNERLQAVNVILQRFAEGTLCTIERTLQGSISSEDEKLLFEAREVLTRAIAGMNRRSCLSPIQAETIGATLLQLIEVCTYVQTQENVTRH